MTWERPSFGAQGGDRIDSDPVRKQIFWLKDSNRKLVNIDIYPDKGFYSAYWEPNIGMRGMLNLVEKTLVFYEHKYFHKEFPLLGKALGKNGKRDYNDDTQISVIIGAEGSRKEFSHADNPTPYRRPLSFKDFESMAEGKQMDFLRINTDLADFVFNIDRKSKKCTSFALIGNVLDTDGFAWLLQNTAPTGKKDADLLFSQALNYFKKEAKLIR